MPSPESIGDGGHAPEPPRAESSWGVFSGFLFGCLLHLLQIPLGAVLALLSIGNRDAFAMAPILPVLGIGISQFLYLGPAIARERRLGRRDREKGLWLCAALTVLLNGFCYASLSRWRWAG